MTIKKTLYMLLDNYLLRKHKYFVVKRPTLDNCETLWKELRKNGWTIYQVIEVDFSGMFRYIVRKKL